VFDPEYAETMKASVALWEKLNEKLEDIGPDAQIGHSYLWAMHEALDGNKDKETIEMFWRCDLLPQLIDSLRSNHKLDLLEAGSSTDETVGGAISVVLDEHFGNSGVVTVSGEGLQQRAIIASNVGALVGSNKTPGLAQKQISGVTKTQWNTANSLSDTKNLCLTINTVQITENGRYWKPMFRATLKYLEKTNSKLFELWRSKMWDERSRTTGWETLEGTDKRINTNYGADDIWGYIIDACKACEIDPESIILRYRAQ
jgi:hypothetical protein